MAHDDYADQDLVLPELETGSSMSVLCGRCKQHHDVAGDVRACYEHTLVPEVLDTEAETFAAVESTTFSAGGRLWASLADCQLQGLEFKRERRVAGRTLDFFCADSAFGIELTRDDHVRFENLGEAGGPSPRVRILSIPEDRVLSDLEAVLNLIRELTTTPVTLEVLETADAFKASGETKPPAIEPPKTDRRDEIDAASEQKRTRLPGREGPSATRSVTNSGAASGKAESQLRKTVQNLAAAWGAKFNGEPIPEQQGPKVPRHSPHPADQVGQEAEEGRPTKWRCDRCAREFFANSSPPPICYECDRRGFEGTAHHVCVRCNKKAQEAGVCERCREARKLASEAAGPGGRGPDGTRTKGSKHGKRYTG